MKTTQDVTKDLIYWLKWTIEGLEKSLIIYKGLLADLEKMQVEETCESCMIDYGD